jgi:hypothetical protein
MYKVSLKNSYFPAQADTNFRALTIADLLREQVGRAGSRLALREISAVSTARPRRQQTRTQKRAPNEMEIASTSMRYGKRWKSPPVDPGVDSYPRGAAGPGQALPRRSKFLCRGLPDGLDRESIRSGSVRGSGDHVFDRVLDPRVSRPWGS